MFLNSSSEWIVTNALVLRPISTFINQNQKNEYLESYFSHFISAISSYREGLRLHYYCFSFNPLRLGSWRYRCVGYIE
jgi:hypothetical protein